MQWLIHYTTVTLDIVHYLTHIQHTVFQPVLKCKCLSFQTHNITLCEMQY